MQAEGLLTQLGYTINESVLAQMRRIIDNTTAFEKLEKHIIQLNDALKPHSSYVAMSSSADYLKVKNEAEYQEDIEKVNAIIRKWADKYKAKLHKVGGKNTYYIVGFEG